MHGILVGTGSPPTGNGFLVRIPYKAGVDAFHR